MKLLLNVFAVLLTFTAVSFDLKAQETSSEAAAVLKMPGTADQFVEATEALSVFIVEAQKTRRLNYDEFAGLVEKMSTSLKMYPFLTATSLEEAQAMLKKFLAMCETYLDLRRQHENEKNIEFTSQKYNSKLATLGFSLTGSLDFKKIAALLLAHEQHMRTLELGQITDDLQKALDKAKKSLEEIGKK